jgi:hypothetical protein
MAERCRNLRSMRYPTRKRAYLLGIIGACLNNVCVDAFLMPSHHTFLGPCRSIRMLLQADGDQPDETYSNAQDVVGESIAHNINPSRRSILVSTTAAALSTAGLLLPPQSSNAAEAPAPVDDRVALRTSNTYTPTKYVGTSTSYMSPPLETPNNAALLCADPDERRIAVFERAAPGVVYIDTFIEQRDAFSTNV